MKKKKTNKFLSLVRLEIFVVRRTQFLFYEYSLVHLGQKLG